MRAVVWVAIALAPAALLLDPHAAFYGDWTTHLWVIGYFGEFFREHLRFPSEMATAGAIGLPLPVFYGYLLYPALGLLSALVGAAAALRLGIAALLLFQAWALAAAGRAVFGRGRIAAAVAAAALWSAYSLTDLYNRSAIAEVFANGFLVAAVGFGVAAAAEPERRRRWRLGWLAGVSAVAMIGSHPPTAVIGAPLLVVLLAFVGRAARRCGLGQSSSDRPAKAGGAVPGLALALLGIGTLLPWIYATVRWASKLGIYASYKGIRYFLDRGDSLAARLSPVPCDLAAWKGGIAGLSTPYLEAPLAAGLIVAVLVNVAVWRRLRSAPEIRPATAWDRASGPVLGAAASGVVFLAALSVSWRLGGHFRFLGPCVQFAFRLVGPANAMLLAAVFASGAKASIKGGFERLRPAVRAGFLVVGALAALGLWVKLDHGAAVRGEEAAPQFAASGDRSALISDYSGLASDYSTPSRVRELTAAELAGAKPVAFPIRTGDGRFAEVEPATINLPEKGWVVTNVVVFPWNRVRANGARVTGPKLARKGALLAVWLPAGRTELEWRWRVDPVWGWLRMLGALCLLLVAAGTIAVGVVEATPSSPQPGKRRRGRRLHEIFRHRWFVIGASVCAVVFAWFVTDGTFRLTYPESFGSFFDYQARSLLHGRLDVPPEAIGNEAFIYGGRTYGYFGLTPAVLRLPFAVVGIGFGELSRWMMLGYFVASLFLAYLIFCHLRRRAGCPPPAGLVLLFLANVGLGSTLLFLGSRAYIYHEAILCGVPFGLFGVYAALRYLETPSRRWAAAAVVGGLLAVQARPPIGLFSLTFTALAALFKGWRERRFGPAAGIAALCAGAFLSINALSFLKFRTFDPMPLKYSANYIGARLVGRGSRLGYLSNLRYNLDAYLLRPNEEIRGRFPYIFIHRLRPGAYPGITMPVVEATLGPPYAMPGLVLLTAIAFAAALLPPRNGTGGVVWPLGLAVLPVIGLIALLPWASHRYTADFCPFLVVGGALGLAAVESGRFGRGWKGLLFIATALAVATNVALTFHYEGDEVWGVPPEARRHYHRLATEVDAFFSRP